MIRLRGLHTPAFPFRPLRGGRTMHTVSGGVQSVEQPVDPVADLLGHDPPHDFGERHDMRTWQVERRKRTRHLIELGGLVVKAGVIELTGDDRATILGALLWIAEKLQGDQGEAEKGKQAFEADNVI